MASKGMRQSQLEYFSTQTEQDTRMAYNVDDNIEYFRVAQAGSSAASSVWKIKKFGYSGSNIVSITFADSVTAYNKIWDDRASYSY